MKFGNHVVAGMTVTPSLGSGNATPNSQPQPQGQQVGQGVLEQPPSSTTPYNPFTQEHQ
jgi:hypothetical protein